MKFSINFIDGHDLKFKTTSVTADTEEEAESKLYEIYGNFDHQITNIQPFKICPECQKEVDRNDMQYTRDCHGITFRLLCWKCYNKAMAKGYDGEYYTELDECLDYEY